MNKSQKYKLNNSGAVSMVVPMIFIIVIAIVLAVFGMWSYFQFTNERDNTAKNVQTAVAAERAVIRQEEIEKLEEREKSPFDTYSASDEKSRISLAYPKTWSAFIDEKTSGSTELEAYFHPGFIVPEDIKQPYAFRLLFLDKGFDAEVSSYDSLVDRGILKSKKVTVNDVEGLRLDGEIENDITGSVVLIPVRDKTIKLSTEAERYQDDFDTILENFTFNP